MSINPEVSKDVQLMVSASPHVRCSESISKIMWNVNLALLPAALFSIYNFGLPALSVMITCIVTAVATEAVVQKLLGKPITIQDGSAFLTGLLLAFNLPPILPLWMAALGSFIAIAVAKHTMGGLGHNIFNPALIGRAFLLASFPVAMTTWSKMPSVAATAVDGMTSATPLGILKQQGYDQLVATFGDHASMYKALLLGNINGSLGETSALLLIIGGLYLLWRGYINWEVPVSYIGTVAVLGWIAGGKNGLFSGDPLMFILAGGLMLGAFFMATDMVTTPMTFKGRLIFGIGAGCIVILIRLKGGYPEGVCYSILLMNAVTPLIDRLVKPARFGGRA